MYPLTQRAKAGKMRPAANEKRILGNTSLYYWHVPLLLSLLLQAYSLSVWLNITNKIIRSKCIVPIIVNRLAIGIAIQNTDGFRTGMRCRRAVTYSFRRLFTGLANAALMAWKLTVTMVIKSARTAANTKTTQLMATR